MTTTSHSPKTCQKCGAPVPPDAPQGLCPKCVLAAAAAPEPLPTATAEIPSLERLAVAFPQLQIIELIGRGAMGFVFKARQPHLDRFVALKLLPESLARDPHFAERFSREARTLARLNHPNIVNIFDFGRAGGFYFLLMEFVDGVNLRQAMQAGKFSPAEALAIVPKICEALQYAHDEGVLHRDIKPENILLDAKGRVKIADFGIAKIVAAEQRGSTLTGTGGALGTPHYMAPEQIEKPASVDHRADIYSLGVVFYEMLTGELPLGRFAPPSERTPVDPRVDDVVMRTLEKEREKRFQSAGEVKTNVEHLTESGAGRFKETPAAPVAQHAPTAPWSRKAIVSAALVAGSLPFVLMFLAACAHASFRPEVFLSFTLLCLFGVVGIIGTVLGWSARSEIRAQPVPQRGDELAIFAAWTYPVLTALGVAAGIANLIAGMAGINLFPLIVLLCPVAAFAAVAFGIWALWASLSRGVSLPTTTTTATRRITVAAEISWKAVIGAVLTAISFVPVLILLAFVGYFSREHHGLLGGWEIVLLIASVALSLPALGGTILGWMGLSDVREHKRRGLPLAVFAAMTWPIFLLVALGVFLPVKLLVGDGIRTFSAILMLPVIAGTSTFAIWSVRAAACWGMNQPASEHRGKLKWIFVALLLFGIGFIGIATFAQVQRNRAMARANENPSLVTGNFNSARSKDEVIVTPVPTKERGPGLIEFSWKCYVPSNHVVTFTFHGVSNGVPMIIPGLSGSILAPPSEPTESTVGWGIQQGNLLSPELADKERWDLHIGGLSSSVWLPMRPPLWMTLPGFYPDAIRLRVGETNSLPLIGATNSMNVVVWASLTVERVPPDEFITPIARVGNGTNWHNTQKRDAVSETQ